MKKLMTSLMLGAVALMAMPVTVSAADTATGKAKTLATGETDVNIEFEAADLTKAKPVNPDRPNEVVDPVPGHDLLPVSPNNPSFLYVTDNLTFGNVKINMLNSQTYHANLIKPNQGSSVKTSNFDWTKQFVLEIADGRGEDAGGWALKVSGAAPMMSEEKSAHQIDGAKLTWPTKGNKTTNSGDGDNGVVVNPDDTVVGLNGQSSAALLSADAHKGAGVTIMKFAPDNILLEVPANKAKPKTYRTEVTWSLENTATA